MKLPKAIEILKELPDTDNNDLSPDQQDAVKLGVEALKAIQRHRHDNMPAAFLVLEGETPENETKRG